MPRHPSTTPADDGPTTTRPGTPTPTRRTLLRGAAVTGLTLATSSGTTGATASTRPARALRRGPSLATAVHEPFLLPLGPTPTITPRRAGRTDVFELTAREADVEMLPGLLTRATTYGGQMAPTLLATTGRRTVVRQLNRTAHPLAHHLHGGHVAAVHDGHPHDAVPSGRARGYLYENEQPGATLWLHDHTHDSVEHTYRGLAATYRLGDPAEEHLGLPSGEFDVALQLRDAEVDASGLVWDPHGSFHRPVFLVNGRARPYREVAARRYRFRLLNASNDRFFLLRCQDGREMVQVGADGGLLPAPVAVTYLPLWPGERADVVLDLGDDPVGSSVVLETVATFPGETGELLRLDVVREAHDDSRVPATLREAPDPGAPVVGRELRLRFDPTTGQHLINGRTFDHHREDFVATLGRTERWTVVNEDVQTGIPHSLHPHLNGFRIRSRDGRPPSRTESGVKDTVIVAPGERVELDIRFETHEGTFMYHCHMLSHQMAGMMGQFRVTA